MSYVRGQCCSAVVEWSHLQTVNDSSSQMHGFSRRCQNHLCCIAWSTGPSSYGCQYEKPGSLKMSRLIPLHKRPLPFFYQGKARVCRNIIKGQKPCSAVLWYPLTSLYFGVLVLAVAVVLVNRNDTCWVGFVLESKAECIWRCKAKCISIHGLSGARQKSVKTIFVHHIFKRCWYVVCRFIKEIC